MSWYIWLCLAKLSRLNKHLYIKSWEAMVTNLLNLTTFGNGSGEEEFDVIWHTSFHPQIMDFENA